MVTRSSLTISILAVVMLGCTSAPAPTATPTAVPTAQPTLAPTASPSATPAVPGHFSDEMLSFDYPLRWQAGQFWYPSSVSVLKTYLSTETLRPPCIQSGSAILCRNPIEQLSEGGVLISWWRWGLHHGAPGPDPNSGQLTHIGGRSATVQSAAQSGRCLSMKADESMRVEIPDPTLSGSWTVMDACLREPVAAAQEQIASLLASVEWSSPRPTTTVGLTVDQQEYMLRIFDDTGLVTSVEQDSFGLEDPAAPGEARATGNTVKLAWIGGPCSLEPTLGLAGRADRLLLLLEPDAGLGTAGDCEAIALQFGVKLTVSEPVTQDALYLEVW